MTSSFPACQASCELVFPLVVLTPKSVEFSLRSIPRFVAGRAKTIVTDVFQRFDKPAILRWYPMMIERKSDCKTCQDMEVREENVDFFAGK